MLTVHVNHHHTISLDQCVSDLLERLVCNMEKLVAAIPAIERFNQMANALDDAITQLTTDVSGLTDTVNSAETMISGLAQQLADAIAAAQAAGATAAQLQALTDLHSAIDANTTGLAAAVAANSPPSP